MRNERHDGTNVCMCVHTKVYMHINAGHVACTRKCCCAVVRNDSPTSLQSSCKPKKSISGLRFEATGFSKPLGVWGSGMHLCVPSENDVRTSWLYCCGALTALIPLRNCKKTKLRAFATCRSASNTCGANPGHRQA